MRGTDTTHYRARVDLEKLVKQLPSADRPAAEAVKRSGARFVPVEIWIDDESRLRRITIEQREKEDEGNEAISTSIDLFEYGVDVDVEPPAGALISQEEFDKLSSSLGLEAVEEGGEGEPLSPAEVCDSARENLPKKDAERVCAEIEKSP